MAYEHFYQFYDRLMSDIPYEKYSQLIKQLAKDNDQLLDLGCGTGTILVDLIQNGHLVDGLDLSEDMLFLTQHKLALKNNHTNLFLDDMRQLSRIDYYDIIYSFLDTINYLTEIDAIKDTFKGVYQSLHNGGTFVFDVHSMDYVNLVFDGYSYHEDLDDLTYLWDIETHSTKESTMIHHYLSFFIKQDHSYSRLDESHKQVAYPLQTYITLLESVGFKDIEVLSDFMPGISLEAAKLIIISKKY